MIEPDRGMAEIAGRTLVVIPARNEEATIGSVLQALRNQGFRMIRVVDNSSRDRTAEIAIQSGAEVIYEPHLGYGQACWRGIQDVPDEVEWIFFCDGDGSDDLHSLPLMLAHVGTHDLILGDRTATPQGRSALTTAQRFGNRLATTLIHWGWGHRYRDLGPCRLIRRSALEQMEMGDRGFGWTVEMQVRAVDRGLRIAEVPVAYRPRQGGQSKISGTIQGSVQAGATILTTLARLFQARLQHSPWSCRLRWMSALLILLGCLMVLPVGDFREATNVLRFGGGITVMGLGFVLSWAIASLSARWFWGVALLARLILLFMYPGDDIWRYLWEGYIQTLGFNPYGYAPTAPDLIPYRTEWWPLINHPDVTAIYPPITQWGFRALAAIAPSVLLFKLAFVAADVGVCGLLSQRFGYARTLLYAWNPLILYSFAGGGHYDSWFVLPLVLAWFAGEKHPSTGRSLWASGWLGLSIAVKWISLPIVAFFSWQFLLKQRWGVALMSLILAGLPMAIAALPFCSIDQCSLIPTTSTFVSHGRSAEWIPFWLGLVWAQSRASNALYGVLLAIATAGLLLTSRTFLIYMERYLIVVLLLSPIVHAWYFTWMIPLAVASRNLGTRWVSLSAFVYVALPYRQALGNLDWRLTLLERLLLWVPFVLGSLWTSSADSQVVFRKNSD